MRQALDCWCLPPPGLSWWGPVAQVFVIWRRRVLCSGLRDLAGAGVEAGPPPVVATPRSPARGVVTAGGVSRRLGGVPPLFR